MIIKKYYSYIVPLLTLQCKNILQKDFLHILFLFQKWIWIKLSFIYTHMIFLFALTLRYQYFP